MTAEHDARGRLYTGLGMAGGMLASAVVGLLRQSGRLEELSARYLAASVVPPLLAAAGLRLYDRRPRLASILLIVAAGLLLGIAAVGSANLAGLLWLPGAVLLTLGAHRLWAAAGRPPRRPGA